MSKIKVYEMARKVGMSNKDFLMKLQEWGIDLKSHLNVIEDSDMKIIEGKLKEIGDKKGEMKNLNTNKDTKKIEKKKDEPRIIRREIVQVRDEAIEENKKPNSDFDYDLKPKKVANPEQFRRSDAQIEKKNAPIPSIMDLFKPKTEPKKEEVKPGPEKVAVPTPSEPTKVEEKETVPVEVHETKVEEVKPKETVIEKAPENNNQVNTKPQMGNNRPQNNSRPQNNNYQQGQRPQGNWQNRNNQNNGQNRPQGNRPPFNKQGGDNNKRPQFNRNQNGGQRQNGVENQLKQALKDTPVEQVTKEVRQYKPKQQQKIGRAHV